MFLRLLALLPYRRRLKVGAWLVRKTIAPVARYTRRARNNVDAIYPNWSDIRQRRLAKRSVEQVATMTIENFSGQDFRDHIKGTPISGPGWLILQEAAREGRPVMLVSGHFGNYEAFRATLLEYDIRVGALYRPMSNRFFNAHYVPTLEFAGPMFQQGRKGSAAFFKWVRRGNVGLILLDVSVAKAPYLQFLGSPARTSTMAADAMRRFDGLMIPIFAIRQDDDPTKFEIEVDAPIAHDTPEAMTQAFNDALGSRIAAHPEQWFWIHKRWKGSIRQKRKAQRKLAS